MSIEKLRILNLKIERKFFYKNDGVLIAYDPNFEDLIRKNRKS